MERLKKILKWTGIVLGAMVAIGLVVNAVFVWTTDARLESQLTEIRAAGDPVTLADLARPPIPPEQNAATYLRQAEAGIEAIEKETMDLRLVSECPGFLVPPEDQKRIKAALVAYPNVFPLLKQAAACPNYDAQLDYALPSGEFIGHLCDSAVFQKSLGAARVLRMQATLLVAEGNRDEAVRTALVIFRLTKLFDRNPTIVAYLVALAVRGSANVSVNAALQTGPISKEVRDALDAELAIQERMEGFVSAMKSERAFFLDYFPGDVPISNFWLCCRGFWNQQKSDCLDVWQAVLATMREPIPYRQAEQAIDESLRNAGTMVTAMMSPGLKSPSHAAARTRAELRALRVLNALQTHVPAGSNEVPKLSELGLPAETTTDPFTGKPLHVKKTPQGWLVYSVGSNFQDDGGKLDDNSDVGVGPPPPTAEPGGK